MSYCRFADDSDVYIYASFLDDTPVWCCHVSHDADSRTGEYFLASSREELRDYCLDLQGLGLRVPNKVFKRLGNEMDDEIARQPHAPSDDTEKPERD